MKLEWEDIEDERAGWMCRARVPGGWIYRHTDDLPIYQGGELRYGHAWTTALVFVPEVDS